MNAYHYTVLGLMIIIFAACSTKKIVNLNTSTKIVGHRGFAGLHPENSNIAIQQALDLGIDRIEIDVHQTKDGVVILMHDVSLERTTTVEGLVKNYSYTDLAAVQLRNTANEKIPTLEDVLQQVQGQTTLLIEVKKGNTYYPNIEQHIVNLIRKHQAENWCIIQSFDDAILQKIHAIAPDLSLHKLLITPYFFNLNKYDFVKEITVNHYFLSRRFIQRIHAKNKKVNTWTVNDTARMRILIARGVDGIITDRPDLLKQLLNN